MAVRRVHNPMHLADWRSRCQLCNTVVQGKFGLRESATLLKQPIRLLTNSKKDGDFIDFTTKGGLGTDKTPIFFTKRIDRMWRILSARGVQPGAVEEDRQGIRYFEIRDPEGNVIEVVEEPRL